MICRNRVSWKISLVCSVYKNRLRKNDLILISVTQTLLFNNQNTFVPTFIGFIILFRSETLWLNFSIRLGLFIMISSYSKEIVVCYSKGNDFLIELYTWENFKFHPCFIAFPSSIYALLRWTSHHTFRWTRRRTRIADCGIKLETVSKTPLGEICAEGISLGKLGKDFLVELKKETPRFLAGVSN